MRKFNLFAVLNENVLDLGVMRSENEEEALDVARYGAIGLYNMNPIRDVVEIMEQENVNEDEAFEIFNQEANDNVKYFVMEEPNEDNGYRLHRYER